MTERDYITLHLRIHGRVQGVGYRAWTVGQAGKRGLSGWVRNRSDGTVEALVSGDAAQVEDMIQACWSGPLAARVDEIVREEAEEEVEEGFYQWPTV